LFTLRFQAISATPPPLISTTVEPGAVQTLPTSAQPARHIA
jgi:hypothetical protein